MITIRFFYCDQVKLNRFCCFHNGSSIAGLSAERSADSSGDDVADGTPAVPASDHTPTTDAQDTVAESLSSAPQHKAAGAAAAKTVSAAAPASLSTNGCSRVRRKSSGSHQQDSNNGFERLGANSSRKRRRKMVESSARRKNPLERLEFWMDRDCGYVHRQVGFCAQWCLDNLCELLWKSLS